jgi:N-acetylmuramoyl-L-alanine amidase
MEGAARIAISMIPRRKGWMLCATLVLSAVPPAWCASGQYGPGRANGFARAERMREALEGRPEAQRTRLQYERVLDAYRAIYHSDPASPKADASIAAVADLLAEEGRVFQDAKSLRDAISQYEFLRREYPASRFRFSALLTEGEIYQRDFGDLEQAKAIYLNFLRMYPAQPLAVEAKTELRNIRRDEVAAKRGAAPAARGAATTGGSAGRPTGGGTSAGHRNTVLTAAIGSQGAAPSTTARATQNPPAPNNQRTGTQNAKAPSRTAQSGQLQAGLGATTSRTARASSSGLQENDIPESLLPPTQEASPSTLARSTNGMSAEAARETSTDDELNAPPPPSRSQVPLITGIRHWSTPVYTRVAIDLQQQVRYTAARVPNPDRIYFDLYGTRLSPELVGRALEVTDDGFLSRIRVMQFGGNIARIVLDVNSVSDYSAFFLANPSRLIIDVHGMRPSSPFATQPMRIARNAPVPTGNGIGSAQPPAANGSQPRTAQRSVPARATTQAEVFPSADANADSAEDEGSEPGSAPSSVPDPVRVTKAAANSASALADVATLSNQPNEVRATKRPTTAPVVASVAGTTRAPQPNSVAASTTTSNPPPATTRRRSAKPSAARVADDVPPVEAGSPGIPAAPAASAEHATSSMMRALGLKINRIVIDAGHGGHDSGTLGPGGIEEKDVVLDVALRLGKLLKDKLGAQVVYTRSDDTFIPLETRTAIANQAQADLFISVHANSSPDTSARGVEVYYLNFTSSADALEVAARENAVSNESIHQLSDLVKKIALQDKISESKEFADDVDQSLYAGLEEGNAGLKDRGVKKAPFVVLIGANMPSILAEISFLTNPQDAQELREGAYRERIAESLYRGVARYVSSMNGMRVAKNGE